MTEAPPVSPLSWPPRSGSWARPRKARKARLVVAALIGLTVGYLAGWAFADPQASPSPKVEGALLRALYELEACGQALDWSEWDRQEALEMLEEATTTRRDAIVRTAAVISEHPWLCDPSARRLERAPVPDPPAPLVVSGITAL